jgi:hypothetical protein
VLQILIAIKKSIASALFEPANLGANVKHANHYTTEATFRVSHSVYYRPDDEGSTYF